MTNQELKLIMRDSVLEAIDKIVEDYPIGKLEDSYLPFLFECLDELTTKMSGLEDYYND